MEPSRVSAAPHSAAAARARGTASASPRRARTAGARTRPERVRRGVTFSTLAASSAFAAALRRHPAGGRGRGPRGRRASGRPAGGGPKGHLLFSFAPGPLDEAGAREPESGPARAATPASKPGRPSSASERSAQATGSSSASRERRTARRPASAGEVTPASRRTIARGSDEAAPSTRRYDESEREEELAGSGEGVPAGAVEASVGPGLDALGVGRADQVEEARRPEKDGLEPGSGRAGLGKARPCRAP